MACVPDETVYTVADYNKYKLDMLSGVKEVQYADKRIVNYSAADKFILLRMMQQAIWGHCPEFSALGRKITVTSSKGIC